MDDLKYLLYQHNVVTHKGCVNKNCNKLLVGTLLGDRLISSTIFIDEIQGVTSFPERIYCVVNNLSTIPRCTCGASLKFVSFTKGYQKYCGSVCANTDPSAKAKRLETNNIRYGGNAPAAAVDVRNKAKETNRRLYGADFHQQASNVRQQTMLERYGSETYLTSDDYKTQKNALLEDRNVTHFNQQHISSESLSRLQDSTWLRTQHHTYKQTIYQIADILKVSSYCVRSYLQLHNIEVSRHSLTVPHHTVIAFLRDLGVEDIRINDRSVINPQEIDIYLPKYKVAIEINGNMWHSEAFGRKDQNYHLNKTEQCSSRGIRLIHIFEHQVHKTPDIVKSRLAQIIGLQTKSIFARKCHVRKISTAEGNAFFEETHIQGGCPSTVSYGLFFNETLQAVMSFGKPRFNKDVEWELIRYSSAIGVRVVGGASKLYAHFVKQHTPTSVISYSDRTWNTGDLYTKLGFTLMGVSKPNYWYFHTSKPLDTYHRSKFQKHKLPKLLQTFDPQKTEWENMINNKYDRYWDCGNYVFLSQRL